MAFVTASALCLRERSAARNRDRHVTHMSTNIFDPTLYLVTDRRVRAGSTVEEIVRSALRGVGQARVTAVQLRDKEVERSKTLLLGRALRVATREMGAKLLINDSATLAAELEADGVHLGQEDGSVAEAREMLGANAVIGVSAGTIIEAENAIADGADYLGVGSVFATGTKADAGVPIGVSGLGAVVDAVAGRVPVVAIGGVHVGNAGLCGEVGADGIAVVSAVMNAHDPAEAAAALYAEMRRN